MDPRFLKLNFTFSKVCFHQGACIYFFFALTSVNYHERWHNFFGGLVAEGHLEFKLEFESVDSPLIV